MPRTSLLILLLLASVTGYAQQGSGVMAGRRINTFAAIEASRDKILDSIYTVRTGTAIAYINGHEYYPYHYRAKHKPLLFFGKERTAAITVSGREYDNLILQYDTYTDEVVFSEIENEFGSRIYQISVNKDIVSSFNLFFRDDTLKFKYFNEEESGRGMPSGFYEVAYSGTSGYLVRHRSVVHERNGIDQYFYAPVGYVMTASGYQKVSSGNRFIKLFGEGSAEMKGIIDQRRMNMRKAGKNEIINLLKAYDSLRDVTHKR